MSFPTTLDTFTTPNGSQYMDDPAVLQTTLITALNDSSTALQVSVWVTGSADTASLRYMQERLTTKWDMLVHNWSEIVTLPTGTDWYMLVNDSGTSTWKNWIAPTSWGTVTSAGFTNWNWFTGSVANPTTTPTFSLWTSITGLLKWLAWAIVQAVAWTDYSVPTGVETLTNKTLTSPAINSPTITTPTINVGSDANGDLLTRAGGTTARLAVWTTWDFITVSGWAPVYDNPFAYEGTLNIATASSNWSGVWGSTHYQTSENTVGTVALTRWTSWYAKVRYSPDNVTFTDIYSLSSAGSNTFPLPMRKGYWYYVEVDSPIAGTASQASLTALF